MFLNRYLSNEKNNFADNSSVEPAIVLMEKLSFSMKLFLAIFMGKPSLRLFEVLQRLGPFKVSIILRPVLLEEAKGMHK